MDSAFPLIERTDAYGPNPLSWWLGGLAFLITTLLIAAYCVANVYSKRNKKIQPTHKQDYSKILRETLLKIEELERKTTSKSISTIKSAEELSAICRTFVDTVMSSKSIALTLGEIKQKKLNSWLDNIIESCYEFEFSNTQSSHESITELIKKTRIEVEKWQ